MLTSQWAAGAYENLLEATVSSIWSFCSAFLTALIRLPQPALPLRNEAETLEADAARRRSTAEGHGLLLVSVTYRGPYPWDGSGELG